MNVKSLTRQELEYIFSDIHFPLEPMHHQFVSLAFGIDKDRVSFCHDVGTGKTLCALYLAKLWNCKKTLVVTPSSAFGSWRRDLENNTDFSYTFLIGSGRERKRQLKKKKDVYVITYAGLKTIYAKLYKKVGWKIQFDSFVHNFDCVVLDEDHRCNVYNALQSKICYELSRRVKHLIGMTGTLIDKSYLELFNIYRVLDLGKSLGTNFFVYRHRYFNRVECGSKWGKKWWEWELKPGAEQEILDKISGITLCYDREECFELPPVHSIIKYIQPSKQFIELQEEIIENKLLKIPGTNISIGKEIKAKAHVLRELPSGFFYYGKDKEVYKLKENPKVEALLDLLEDTSSKVVVFYWYVKERDIIEKALKKKNISFCSVFGGQGDFDKENEIEQFSKDDKAKVLLSQCTCANEGFDAFVANIVVFFSPVGSPKIRKQCIGRIRRKGQKRKCLVIDFVLEDSMEEKVIEKRGPRFNFVRTAMEYIKDFHQSSSVEEV